MTEIEIKIILPIEPVPTPRPRVTRHHGKSLVFYSKKYRDFKSTARTYLKHNYKKREDKYYNGADMYYYNVGVPRIHKQLKTNKKCREFHPLL